MATESMPPEDGEAPAPGAGARRRHERLRAARLRRGEGDLGPTAVEAAWSKGAEGERRLGEALNRAARDVGDVAVLHDLVLPGKRANIDHVVVGPAGVTIVDAKAWDGDVRFDGRMLRQNGRARNRALREMGPQLDRVHAVLSRGGRDDVPIEAVVCLVNGLRTGNGLYTLPGVSLGGVVPVLEHAMRPGRLTLDDIGAVCRSLQAAFRIHGGMVAAGTSPARPRPSVAPPCRARAVAHGAGGRRRRATARPLLRPLRRAGLVGFALALLLVAAMLLSATRPPAASVGSGALKSRVPQFRTMAEQRAGGPVRGPRVVARPDAYVLGFRRGRRCRVAIIVARDRPSELTAPRVRAARCRIG